MADSCANGFTSDIDGCTSCAACYFEGSGHESAGGQSDEGKERRENFHRGDLFNVAGAMFGDGFEGMVDVPLRGDRIVDPNQLLIVKEKADASRPMFGMRDLESITHGTIDVAEERKGEVVFIGKSFLLGDRIHGHTQSTDFSGG